MSDLLIDLLSLLFSLQNDLGFLSAFVHRSADDMFEASSERMPNQFLEFASNHPVFATVSW